MERRLALWLSVALHPSALPLWGTALILSIQPNGLPSAFWMMTLLVVLAGTVLLPAVVTIGMRQAGMISGLHLDVAADRRWPFLAGSAFFLLTSRALSGHPFPPELSRYLLGLGLAILVAVFALPRYKISAHMGGIGGLWGLTLYLADEYGAPMAGPMALLAVATGAIWWARTALHAHRASELLWGGLIGGLSVLGLLQIIP